MIDLPILWALVIGIGVLMYILLDGFDLGVGILFPFIKSSEEKDIVMNSVAPLWDGNETWLVLGGAGLLAAFPKAYAMLLSSLYVPLMLFLFGLVFRGIAFEFRFKATKYQSVWNSSFSLGSMLATFMQGIVLGTFVQGLPIVNGVLVAKPFFWITPFSVMTGIALIAGYGLLGSTWLIMKTEGALQAHCRKMAVRLMFLTLFFILLVSLWTPFAQHAIFHRWFDWPNILYFLPVPVHTTILSIILFWSLRHKNEVLPFIASVGLFFLSYTGLLISLWPYIVPRVLTIWEAAAPPESQLFSLVGVLFLLPLIFAYTIHAYWVFRGKAMAEKHY